MFRSIRKIIVTKNTVIPPCDLEVFRFAVPTAKSNPSELLQPVIPTDLRHIDRLFAIDICTMRPVGEMDRSLALFAAPSNQIAVQHSDFHALPAHDVHYAM